MNHEISRRISFLGFVMTCGIVFYHCGPSPTIPSTKMDQICFNAISNFFTSVAPLAMCYFFTVTGYLLFLNLSLLNWAHKVKRRVFSLLVPYLAWQCLTFAANLLHHEAMTKREFLKTTFLLGQWPPDGALWYLYAVFLLPIPDFLCDRKIYHLSFLVYALHQPLLKHFLHPIRDLISVLCPFSPPASLINGLGRVLYFLFILCLARVLHTILTRFSPKTLNVLTGGRT